MIYIFLASIYHDLEENFSISFKILLVNIYFNDIIIINKVHQKSIYIKLVLRNFMKKNKSVLKRIKVNERNRMRNKMYKSVVKTYMKRFLSELQSLDINNTDAILATNKTLSLAYSTIDKAVKRSVLHVNNGARKKALLARKLKNKITTF
jgi:small subunit ribosomal protein S20